jgi:hypothetical protein
MSIITYSGLAYHLLGSVDEESATRTTFTFGSLDSLFGLNGNISSSRSADQSGRVTIAETFRSESFAVASLAVNVLVGSITSQNRVKWPVAIAAMETFFVPFLFMKFQML